MNERDLWSEICGEVEPGEVTILPSEELTLTPPNFDEINPIPLELNGEIIFHGYPILHTVEISKKSHHEQNILFQKFLSLNNGGIKLKVLNGIIEDMTLTYQSAKEAYEALKQWFQANEKYRIIVKIGFGLNDALELVKENCSLNKTYGGDDICIHFGIGKPPISGHHLDIISPITKIVTSNNQPVIKAQKFSRKIAAICPCEDISRK